MDLSNKTIEELFFKQIRDLSIRTRKEAFESGLGILNWK